MKITVSIIFCLLSAFDAFGQTPASTLPPNVQATAAPVATPAAPVVAIPAPVVTTPAITPAPAFTPPPTATLATPSATPDADDTIDNMIESKIRRHFEFTAGKHHFRTDGDDGDAAWLAVPIVFIVFLAIFGMPVLIVAVILYFSFSRNRAMHKTVRMMVEKGQPVPESLLNPPPVVRQRSDLRRGIKWMLWGVGVMIFFGACNDWEGGAWSLGIIPFLIGVAYIIFWRLDLRQIPPSLPPSPPV